MSLVAAFCLNTVQYATNSNVLTYRCSGKQRVLKLLRKILGPISVLLEIYTGFPAVEELCQPVKI